MGDADFAVGDVIDISGIYADGTCARLDDNGHALYVNKPLAKWKVEAITARGVKLTPLNPDGSVNEFNAACGEYWIENK